MIEFELKYKLEKKVERLNLNQTKQISQTDVYYDTAEGTLYSNGNFLRIRNGEKIDFKLFAGDKTHSYCKETSFKVSSVSSQNEAFASVLCHLGFEKKNFSNFEEFLKAYSLTVLATIEKNRKEYALQNLIISLDEVKNLGCFLEAECRFENNNIDIESEKAKMQKILCDNELINPASDKAVKIGYVELYLKEHNYSIYLKGMYKE